MAGKVPRVSVRFSNLWLEMIDEVSRRTGKTRADLVREAVGHFRQSRAAVHDWAIIPELQKIGEDTATSKMRAALQIRREKGDCFEGLEVEISTIVRKSLHWATTGGLRDWTALFDRVEPKIEYFKLPVELLRQCSNFLQAQEDDCVSLEVRSPVAMALQKLNGEVTITREGQTITINELEEVLTEVKDSQGILDSMHGWGMYPKGVQKTHKSKVLCMAIESDKVEVGWITKVTDAFGSPIFRWVSE